MKRKVFEGGCIMSPLRHPMKHPWVSCARRFNFMYIEETYNELFAVYELVRKGELKNLHNIFMHSYSRQDNFQRSVHWIHGKTLYELANAYHKGIYEKVVFCDIESLTKTLDDKGLLQTWILSRLDPR